MKTKKQNWIYSLTLFGLILVTSIGCQKGSLPDITTSDIINVKQTTATLGGFISSDGGSAIIDRGICWSTEQMPIVVDNHISKGTMLESFFANITGLNQQTTYYVRAYAINRVGVAYGEEKTFTTEPKIMGTVSDIEGNIYNTITIQNLVWMAEDLRTTKYKNGDLIATTNPHSLDISGEEMPKYQWAYEGNEDHVSIYGRLYTWYTATDIRGVCPINWHVSTEAEWDALTNYLGGEEIAGGFLKEAGTDHWNSPNEGATNELGFNALPGGYRNFTGIYYLIGTLSNWWTIDKTDSSRQVISYLVSMETKIHKSTSLDKKNGANIRCVKNY